MKFSILNRPEVRIDIINATDFYKNINPQLAKQFLFRLREAKTYIASSPLSFQIKYNGVRTLLLKQFPYHIHYLVEESKQQIVILAVIHAYQNPSDYLLK